MIAALREWVLSLGNGQKGKMTAMTSLISLQSRGMPINVKTDGEAAGAYDLGKELYYTRVGQLICHVQTVMKITMVT